MSEIRNDANEVAFLALQLEFMRQREIEIEYALPKALSFVSVKSDVPAGAEAFAYYELDKRAEAAWLANGATDIPLADVSGAKKVSPLARMASGYRYTFDDVQRALMAGLNLDQKRRDAARDALNRKMDSVAALGDVELGFPGLLNHPNVPVLSAAAAAAGSHAKPWDGADKVPLEILADMNALVNKIADQTLDLHAANVLLLPSTHYRLISDTPLAANGYNSDSILNAFKKNHPEVSVLPWILLANADAAGTGQRAMAYEMSPNNMEFVVADPISEDAPERKGRSYEIAMTAKVGGCVVYRPLAAAYMDLI